MYSVCLLIIVMGLQSICQMLIIRRRTQNFMTIDQVEPVLKQIYMIWNPMTTGLLSYVNINYIISMRFGGLNH